jgi:hypothetical protein
MTAVRSDGNSVEVRAGARGAGRERGLSHGIVLALAAVGLFVAVTPAAAQRGPGGGRGGAQPEMAVVERFDADQNGRLNTAERAQARAWLAEQPTGGPGGRRMGGPGGAPGGGRAGPPPGFRGGRAGGPPGGGGRGGRGIVSGTAGVQLAPSDVRSYGSESLYDPAALRTLFIDFPNADWEEELAAFYNTDVEVPATLRVDGRTYAEVGVGFRGASSYGMIPAGSKRSLNVSIDYANDDQALGGYRSLNLLNANNDPTFVRTALYSHIAREYTPTPMVNFVRVVINGENWGVYPSAQQFNRDFVRDFYGTTEGARWKAPGSPGGRAGMEYLGDDVDAYRRLYEIKTKDDPESWTALIDLFRVLNETPADRLEAALAPILDVDGVLRFLALDIALANSDGYWTRASDYNLYRDSDGRFHVIPHDMNEALGIGGPGGGGVRLDPLTGLEDPTKPLRSKLLAVPALRERYLGYVRDIAERWMDWGTVGPLVAEYQALIREDVQRDTRKLYATEAFDSGVEELKSFLAQRREYLLAYGR